ncbi:hypothetical protein BRC93_05660 [Halobacteriales archaeon QS_5_70_15]|nr:MAG: hypothetical protein BRC93_05660 [Halobacteriales archaeon QS_5_70_15]
MSRSRSRRTGGPRRLLSMTWRDLLFAHWTVAPDTVATRLPDRLSVDTFEGEASLGAVPFRMEIGPAGLPLRLTFDELNLRTYVRGPDGRRGVYFFNLDADDPLGVAVARSLFRLPYYRAETEVERSGDRVRFRSRRTHGGASPARFEASYGPVEGAVAATPEPGSLEAFLVEHYRFYTTDDRGRVYHGDIDHGPWSLRPAWAEFEENTLFEASGFERPTGEPTLHVADRVEVTAGRVRRT